MHMNQRPMPALHRPLNMPPTTADRFVALKWWQLQRSHVLHWTWDFGTSRTGQHVPLW